MAVRGAPPTRAASLQIRLKLTPNNAPPSLEIRSDGLQLTYLLAVLSAQPQGGTPDCVLTAGRRPRTVGRHAHGRPDRHGAVGCGLIRHLCIHHRLCVLHRHTDGAYPVGGHGLHARRPHPRDGSLPKLAHTGHPLGHLHVQHPLGGHPPDALHGAGRGRGRDGHPVFQDACLQPHSLPLFHRHQAVP